MSAAQIEALYHNLIAIGDGVVRLTDLTQLLLAATTKTQAQTKEARPLELAEPENVNGAEAQMTELTEGWDAMRLSHANESELPDEEREEHFHLHLQHIVNIQRRFLGRIRNVRARLNAKAKEAPNTVGSLFGMHVEGVRRQA